MDEQAGPGVLFNNSAATTKAPQAADFGGGEAAGAQYNIPGIFHFLQHEWVRLELERANREVERAELQVSFHSRTSSCSLARLAPNLAGKCRNERFFISYHESIFNDKVTEVTCFERLRSRMIRPSPQGAVDPNLTGLTHVFWGRFQFVC